jgi:hypothetical protein
MGWFSRAATRKPAHSALIELLQNPYFFLTALGFYLEMQGRYGLPRLRKYEPRPSSSTPWQGPVAASDGRQQEWTPMETIHPSAIWLIFPAAGLAFMFWVLWNFAKDEMRRFFRERSGSVPLAGEPTPRVVVPEVQSPRRYALYPTHRAVRN